MNKKIIKVNSKKAPQAIGPYSQAVIASGFVFVSGQIAISNGAVSVDVKEQTKKVLENIRHILIEAKSNVSSVVKVDVYLKNISDFALVNEEYEEFFSGVAPSRTTVAVMDLPKGALVEISCIALEK